MASVVLDSACAGMTGGGGFDGGLLFFTVVLRCGGKGNHV